MMALLVAIFMICLMFGSVIFESVMCGLIGATCTCGFSGIALFVLSIV